MSKALRELEVLKLVIQGKLYKSSLTHEELGNCIDWLETFFSEEELLERIETAIELEKKQNDQ